MNGLGVGALGVVPLGGGTGAALGGGLGVGPLGTTALGGGLGSTVR